MSERVAKQNPRGGKGRGGERGVQEWILEIYPTNDYLLLEQFCLDTFVCALNIRRSATSGPYVPNTSPINVGTSNPQYGLSGTDAAHWGGLHTTDLRIRWSRERSSQYYIYDIQTCQQVSGPIEGLSGVAHYLNMSVRSVSDAFNLCKVVGEKYIVTVPPPQRGGRVVKFWWS